MLANYWEDSGHSFATFHLASKEAKKSAEWHSSQGNLPSVWELSGRLFMPCVWMHLPQISKRPTSCVNPEEISWTRDWSCGSPQPLSPLHLSQSPHPSASLPYRLPETESSFLSCLKGIHRRSLAAQRCPCHYCIELAFQVCCPLYPKGQSFLKASGKAVLSVSFQSRLLETSWSWLPKVL